MLLPAPICVDGPPNISFSASTLALLEGNQTCLVPLRHRYLNPILLHGVDRFAGWRVSIDMLTKPSLFAVALVFSSLSLTSGTGETKKLRVPKVQIAVLLDTSSSMDGLINQTKSELWSIVNRFGDSSLHGVTPNVEVALYEYGKDSIPSGEGYLRMVSSFTTDLDQVSEDLFALRTNGGSEYAGLVIDRAVDGLTWSSQQGDYRTIFIAGNEEFTQGPMPYSKAIAKAAGKGITINTIHCGSYNDGVNGKWQHAAKLGEGNFLTIEQNHQVQQIATPFDQELATLSTEINQTYIGYGREGKKKLARQRSQDSNAAKMGAKSVASRAKTKGGGSYKNASWDLVDGVEEGEASIDAIPTQQLPEVMRKMNKKQRKAYVAKKALARKTLQTRIALLSAKREKFIVAERKKSSKKETASTFETAVIKTVNKQMKRKGYKFKK